MSVLRPALLLLACAAIAGCGSEGPAPADGGESTLSELTLELRPAGPEGPLRTAELSCERGVPDPACEALWSIDPAVLDPVPPDQACTQIYGGADELRVTGTLEGRELDAEFNRANGCEIARFEAWLPVLRELFADYEPGGSIQPPG